MDLVELQIPLPLLRLTSSLLPVGAFAYSRGLEHAVEAGWVAEPEGVRSWLFGTIEQSFSALDGALFLRMMRALQEARWQEFRQLDALLSAGRESRELLNEDKRMAEALVALLRDLDMPVVAEPDFRCETFAAAYALAVHDMGVAPPVGLAGLIWSLCEAQVASAIRLGVIGQFDGQRILIDAPPEIVRCVRIAQETPDEEIGNLSFMQAVGSALHETQYSRLFRS